MKIRPIILLFIQLRGSSIPVHLYSQSNYFFLQTKVNKIHIWILDTLNLHGETVHHTENWNFQKNFLLIKENKFSISEI